MFFPLTNQSAATCKSPTVVPELHVIALAIPRWTCVHINEATYDKGKKQTWQPSSIAVGENAQR